MKRTDFSFELPEHLIAQYPLNNRRDSRFLVYDRKTKIIQHKHFRDLSDLLNPGDLLVMNDTQVIPARFFGSKSTGGHVEFLLERILTNNTFLAHARASKALKPGMVIQLQNAYTVEIIERREELFHCRANASIDTILHQIGHVPLPPYITRPDTVFDIERYQTIYAKHKGSVAAPTAGLHFDEPMLAALSAKGVKINYATLHVGSGTFRPVRSEDITQHKMHKERFMISESLSKDIQVTKAAGHRVIAVGTTACRSLESAASQCSELEACSGETDIFIYPGYVFKVCDGLLTNFHLPESTLLMLVSAFIGYEEAMAMYNVAVEEQYRFFSYGDASLLL